MATDPCRELAHDDGGTPILFHGTPNDYLLTHVLECDVGVIPRIIVAPPPYTRRDEREKRDLNDLIVLLEKYLKYQNGN